MGLGLGSQLTPSKTASPLVFCPLHWRKLSGHLLAKSHKSHRYIYIYIYIYIYMGNRKKKLHFHPYFPISHIYISRSTLTYRALYYEKIVTQASYIYIYIRGFKSRSRQFLEFYLCSFISFFLSLVSVHLCYVYIYIYIYTRFQKGFHIEIYIDRYIHLFSCTCARVHFSLVIS